MQKRLVRRLVVPVGCALAAASLALLAHGARLPKPDSKVLTRDQALARVTEIVKSLTPVQGPLQVRIDPLSNLRIDPRGNMFWSADCTDSQGRYVANIVIDSATGETVSVCCVDRESTGNIKALNRSQAVTQAGLWLRSLGLKLRGKHWTVPRTPEKGLNTWFIACRSRDSNVNLSLNAHTGGLITMISTHPISRGLPIRTAHR